MYTDNQNKWVAVLNRKFPIPQLMNALGHLALSIPIRCRDKEAHRHHTHNGSDGSTLALISHWPLIVLEGDNDSQLRTLREDALSQGLVCQAFVGSMLGSSAADQLRRTEQADLNKIDFLAILLFGRAEDLQGLTKKFSLWKASVSPSQNSPSPSPRKEDVFDPYSCEGF